jgi:HSP20 family protein
MTDPRLDPFARLDAMQERLSRLFGDAFFGPGGRAPRWQPDVDIEELSDAWLVEIRLPGVAPEEVALDVTDRELCVRSVQPEEGPGDEQGRQPSAASLRRYADFSYRFTVPADVDAGEIDATMDHGLLTIRLPRTSTSRTRRITVGRRGAIEGESRPGGSQAQVSEVPDTTASDEEIDRP